MIQVRRVLLLPAIVAHIPKCGAESGAKNRLLWPSLLLHRYKRRSRHAGRSIHARCSSCLSVTLQVQLHTHLRFPLRLNSGTMASWMTAILACLCGADPVDVEYPFKERPTLYHDAYTAEEIADQIASAIQSAEKGGNDLRLNLKNIVVDDWTENVAHWTLSKLEQALQDTSNVGVVLKKAYDTALEVALAVEGFTTTHPVFCTVIAIGILVLLAPWALEALGFGELGPIEGRYFP